MLKFRKEISREEPERFLPRPALGGSATHADLFSEKHPLSFGCRLKLRRLSGGSAPGARALESEWPWAGHSRLFQAETQFALWRGSGARLCKSNADSRSLLCEFNARGSHFSRGLDSKTRFSGARSEKALRLIWWSADLRDFPGGLCRGSPSIWGGIRSALGGSGGVKAAFGHCINWLRAADLREMPGIRARLLFAGAPCRGSAGSSALPRTRQPSVAPDPPNKSAFKAKIWRCKLASGAVFTSRSRSETESGNYFRFASIGQ